MPEHRALNLEEIGKLTATAKQLAKRYRALTGNLDICTERPLSGHKILQPYLHDNNSATIKLSGASACVASNRGD